LRQGTNPPAAVDHYAGLIRSADYELAQEEAEREPSPFTDATVRRHVERMLEDL
jgi:hypothetical protein